jgi:hypothetical protein
MKKLILFALVVVSICTVAFAAVPSKITLKGWIVDNTCAASHKADMASFVEVHDMSCARTCGQDSGFSIYSGKKLYPIIKSETQKVITYFGADFNNDTKVIVTLKKTGANYKVLAIKSWR